MTRLHSAALRTMPAKKGRQAQAVVLVADGSGFVMRARGRSLTPVDVELEGGDLEVAVERAVTTSTGTDAKFLGVVAHTDQGPLVAVAVSDGTAFVRDDESLRLVTTGEVRARRREIEHSGYAEAAHDWLVATRLAPDLHSRIRRALDRSIAHLATHRSAMGDLWGWNQFHDRGDFGLLSTAQALLSHVHSGIRGASVERPARTLESQQNPDGGWQVRRSLVVSPSTVSITESTCYCLLALAATGRSTGDRAVRDGVAWLERTRREDHGWSSSAHDDESTVFPTALAVRTLSALNRPDLVADAVTWLRTAQRPDGGWGARGPQADGGRRSSPAYTAYALIALSLAGTPNSDPTVVRGCEYLLGQFEHDRVEPWEPTSYNSLVDPETSARLEYRHYATPWAITALALVGHDLRHPIMMAAVSKLLDLQNSNGTWRSAMIAPDSSALWATHDSVFALSTVIRPTNETLATLLLAPHADRERRALLRVVGEQVDRIEQPPGGQRRWLSKLWMSALTVTVALLALAQFGLLEQVISSSGLAKVWPTLATAVVTLAGAVGPPIIAEEYKIRRQRRDAAR